MSTPTYPGALASNHLVPVFLADIGGVRMHVCDARTLHAFLENGDLFANWFKARVEKYEFVENRDFALILEKTKIKGRGGDRRSQDYILKLQMAKELAMVENNEKGSEARRYFIECEERVQQAHTAPPPAALPEAVQTAINHRVFLVAADALREAVELLTAIAREHLAQGHSIEETVELVAHTPLHRMGLIRRDDLRPVAALLTELLEAVHALIEGRSMPGRGQPG